jgi:hypothetical protein
MAIAHYVNENRSDIWSIKPGWYAMNEDGGLFSAFFSPEECLNGDTHPTIGSTSAKVYLRPK